MRIERKFYSDAKKLQDSICRNIEAEAHAATAEMRVAESAKLREDSQRLYSIYQETTRSDPQPQRAIKWPQFCRLVEKALWMAECCSLDILAEDLVNGRGRIRLETAYFALLENAEPALQAAWVELCRDAAEMIISHREDTFLIELWYAILGQDIKKDRRR